METSDKLVAFRRMVDDLLNERESLLKRVNEINEALRSCGVVANVAEEKPVQGPPPRTIKEAVYRITAEGPKTKEQILDGLRKLGLEFNTKNPVNSLNVYLYKGKFKNQNGKFSPPEGVSLNEL